MILDVAGGFDLRTSFGFDAARAHLGRIARGLHFYVARDRCFARRDGQLCTGVTQFEGRGIEVDLRVGLNRDAVVVEGKFVPLLTKGKSSWA